MLRRSVLAVYRDAVPAEERSRLLRALSFVGLECETVRASDYGDDLLGGSKPLVDVPPWERPPRFRLRDAGPPSNYDVALHLDFDDEAALAAYEADPVAVEVEDLFRVVTVPEITARVDWRYDGDARNGRGAYRHVSMHVWRDDADRAAALAAARTLGAVGEGDDPAGFDWVLDVVLPDEAAMRAFLESAEYTQATRTIAAATKDEWTARVTHWIRGA